MNHFAESLSFFDDDDLMVIEPAQGGGDRQRLRDRFTNCGPASVPDYELLELILFRAIPRFDVKPLALALMDHFGDLNRVLTAAPALLAKVKGCGPAVISELKLIEATAHRMARAKVMHRCVISSWDAVIDYCHTVMAHRDTEQFRILFLDTKNALIADEASLILVHNPPSGDPTPSDSDINMTRQIETAAKALSITVHDHIIIGKSREVSFRDWGLLGNP